MKPSLSELQDVLSSRLRPNTLKSYRSQWQKWALWCQRENLPAVPADPEQMLSFLLYARRKHSWPVLRSVTHAVSHAHAAQGALSPTRDLRVRQLLAALHRDHSVQKKDPLLLEDVRRLVATIDRESLRGKRDAAILLVGFASAMRESEIVGARGEWLRQASSGMGYEIHFPMGKTKMQDRHVKNKVDIVGIPRWRDREMCPSLALEEWLLAMPLLRVADPVFCDLRYKNPRKEGKALRPSFVGELVEEYAERAGLKGDYGGHSLRSGFVTQAVQQKIDLFSVMKTTRHRSLQTLRGYYRPTDALGAGAGLLLDPFKAK